MGLKLSHEESVKIQAALRPLDYLFCEYQGARCCDCGITICLTTGLHEFEEAIRQGYGTVPCRCPVNDRT